MKKIFKNIYTNVFIKYSKFFSRKNLYNFMDFAVEKYCKKKELNILNVGAGGEISEFLKNKGLKFKEIDIDPKRKPDYVMSIENMKQIESESVDIIFCMEVLEHVENPFNAVKEIKRVLKKNGIFIGSTPFIFPIHDEPYDYFRYTKYGIRNLFKEFKCLHLNERNSYIQTIYVLFLRLLNVGNIYQRIVAILLFPIIILLLPVFIILSYLVTNYHITTGYVYIFKNK